MSVSEPNVGASAGVVPTLGNSMNDIDDIAFVMLALRLQSLDGEIATKIENLTAMNEVRKAYQDRINTLRAAQQGKTGKEHVDTPGDLSTSYDYRWNPETKSTEKVENGYYDGESDHGAVQAKTMQSEIDRMQGELDKINGDSELAMMELNRTVNQRQTALQLTTNIMSSVHQSQMGIIQNIGK